MSWSNRDKDLENNVNSLFKRRFPRYRRRGIFDSLLEAYLTQWREKLLPVTVLDPSNIRELKIRWQRRQRELHKSNRFNNQKNNFARASRFFVHFPAVTARLRRENAQFHVVQRKYTSDDEISSLFLHLAMVLRNSTLGWFAYIWKS